MRYTIIAAVVTVSVAAIAAYPAYMVAYARRYGKRAATPLEARLLAKLASIKLDNEWETTILGSSGKRIFRITEATDTDEDE